MQNYRKLTVWEKSHTLGLLIYRLTREFPRSEQYGITQQMRRAAVSIASNIAEGCGRKGNVEFAHYLDIAKGSANELGYQLLLSRDLSYIGLGAHSEAESHLEEIQKMLATLIIRVREQSPRSTVNRKL
jgi:four helix bundle protein